MRVFTASQTLKADWMLPSVLSSAAESHVSLCSGQVTDLAVVKYRVSLPCETLEECFGSLSVSMVKHHQSGFQYLAESIVASVSIHVSR